MQKHRSQKKIYELLQQLEQIKRNNMLTILLKITTIWLLLLLAYFTLLSKEKAPQLNRAFLWLALLTGISVLFIKNPFLSVQPAVQTVTQIIAPVNNLTANNPQITTAANKETSTWDRAKQSPLQTGNNTLTNP